MQTYTVFACRCVSSPLSHDATEPDGGAEYWCRCSQGAPCLWPLWCCIEYSQVHLVLSFSNSVSRLICRTCGTLGYGRIKKWACLRPFPPNTQLFPPRRTDSLGILWKVFKIWIYERKYSAKSRWYLCLSLIHFTMCSMHNGEQICHHNNPYNTHHQLNTSIVN